MLRDYPAFELASQVARWHHERWDGTAIRTPRRRRIPTPVAIASVADALDAMIYDRVYRLGRPRRAALEELTAGSGTQFSPRVVRALVDLFQEGNLPVGLHRTSWRPPGGVS
jgi:HD-GYP domain-containing protein (c-di-GMP phosphodiesterase class II)